MLNSKKNILFYSALFLLLNSAALPAVVLNVPSPTYPTIQSALDDIFFGDETILLAPGVYQGPGNRDLTFDTSLGIGITICSADPNHPESVIIDCQGTSADPHRGFLFGGYNINIM